ncbi:MAG: glycerophosphodiester phosphodiesterase [Clostridia bacterium]|nr:glycerophosphodiester phosphodiesterase [Clostridia bacterium]
MNYWRQSKNNIYVAAHRGWSEKYPENTMIAYRAAAELGVDQIEIDVRVTKDGELVIIHDATVDRTTNGTGKVEDLTLAELLELDAGSWKGAEFAGQRIPTFAEFLEFAVTLPEMTYDIELKEYPTDGREELSYSVCDRVLALLDENGLSERCVINTFSGKLHEYIYKKYGMKYRLHVYFPITCLGTDMTLFPYSYAYCSCVFSTNKSDFEYIDRCGIQPWAGASVKDEETVDLAIANGSELITCNNPDVVLELLRKKGYHD